MVARSPGPVSTIRAVWSPWSARERRSLTLGWSLGPVLYALMMAIAAVDPRYSIAGFALIHVLYLLPTARLVASVQRVRQKRTGAEPRRSRT